MLTVEQIQSGLADRRIGVVADATGITRVALYNILSGKTKNPSYNTVVALSKYLTKGYEQ